VFNALTADQLIAGLGSVLRAAAAATEPPDEYARGQLLSAYSITRLLTAEQRASAGLLTWLRTELRDALAPCSDEAAVAARERIAQAADAPAIGAVLVDLLAKLRSGDREPQARARVHAVLRTMADLELAALAGRPLDAGEAA